jgi:tRNA A-37 threonylcarbamoyl transferase component Bud32
LFACKIPLEEAKETEEMLFDEALIMSKISKYPNKSPFLTFYGVYFHENKPMAVYELFDGWQLSNLKYKLNEIELLHMAKALYEQITYLNNQDIYHGDVYNSNILYNATRFVLIDITGQIPVDEYSHVNAEVAKTTIEIWV